MKKNIKMFTVIGVLASLAMTTGVLATENFAEVNLDEVTFATTMDLPAGEYELMTPNLPNNEFEVLTEAGDWNPDLMNDTPIVPEFVGGALELNEELLVEEREILSFTNTITDLESGKVLVSVREVFEGLGYEVEYVHESKSINLINGASFITFVIGEDAYAFGRMAHQSLGTAPILQDSTTYVPVELLELAGIDYMVNRNTVNVFVGEEQGLGLIEGASLVSILNVEEAEEEGTHLVTIFDVNRGENNEEVVLVLTAEQLESLDPLNSKLQVIYSERMTMSMPPQNVPELVVSFDDSIYLNMAVGGDELVEGASAVTILGLEEAEGQEGTYLMTVQDETLGEVVLVLTEEQVSSLDALNSKLQVVYSPMMTMSIPPQNVPTFVSSLGASNYANMLENIPAEGELNLTIVNIEAPIDGVSSIVTINGLEEAEGEEGTYLMTVKDDVKGDVVLVLTEEQVSSLDALNNKLEVVYSERMTMSIPPQNVPTYVASFDGSNYTHMNIVQ